MKHNILVFSSLFPSDAAPSNGLFIRERMFRVAQHVNLTVVSPVPWFPGQQLVRIFKKNYRLLPEKKEIQQGITVYFPRFFSFPGVLRNLDALMMYLCCFLLVRKLKNEQHIEIIDSHFTYPDGLAATWLAQKLGMKSIITLRGTEIPHKKIPGRKKQLLKAWEQADRLFSVSNSLCQHAIELGADADKITVIGNGIDTDKFKPIVKADAKEILNIDADAKVLITVGGLVERKGFHRVLECLPPLLAEFPKLVYLIVGGANAEGNYKPQICALTDKLAVTEHVRFLGVLSPEELSVPLSAADAVVLSSSNEGWANVILEAMACGTPVVATDVGGNAEVVDSEELGAIVPFGDHQKLLEAIQCALHRDWQVTMLTQYAQDNHWNHRINVILKEYDRLTELSI
jgi:teichuronic acid biosynthesis glycosyltransferase TuaC